MGDTEAKVDTIAVTVSSWEHFIAIKRQPADMSPMNPIMPFTSRAGYTSGSAVVRVFGQQASNELAGGGGGGDWPEGAFLHCECPDL